MQFKHIIIIHLSVVAVFGAAWIVNLYKLTQCDFMPSWKGEIIHSIGIIPPAAIVTVWFSDK
jgi:hypothetical protein